MKTIFDKKSMYYDFYKSFYIKQANYWRDVHEKTGSKISLDRYKELKDFIYEKYLVELEEAPKIEKGQALLNL